VWLVSFVVLLVNAFLAEALVVAVRRGRLLRSAQTIPPAYRWLIAAAAILAINVGYGAVRLNSERPIETTSRIALVQQNNDPRKHEYRATFETLRRLTDEALAYEPDLVVWSETAFVPNIRRWSQEDPQRYNLAALVEDLLGYLEEVDTWLLTGNDDYQRVFDDSGEEIGRNSFNAAVLFSDDDRRIDTYHKVKLVPFTEHFPYQEQLPWVYDLLMSVDITFWTPGDEYVVFSHPQFDFATPICFEDVFPRVVRQFALGGMDVIVNITNDYWSLREQAAQQHFAAAMFRSVELGIPMVRATASGVTSHIDDRGRIVATVPQYSEEFLIADVAVVRGDDTLYRRFGDWMPIAAGIAVVIVVAVISGLSYSTAGRRSRWK
jgi:apolipoprotein N-acyltransferase